MLYDCVVLDAIFSFFFHDIPCDWLCIAIYLCFHALMGLKLGRKNALKARRPFQTRKHLEEVGTVGTKITVTNSFGL